GRQNHKCGENAVRGNVVAAMHAGLQTRSGHLRAPFVPNQTDSNLFHTKKNSEYINSFHPVRLVPGVIRNKNCVPAYRPNRFCTAILRDFHRVTTRKRNRETREVGDVRQRRRHSRSVAEMYVTNAALAQKSFELVDHNLVCGESCTSRSNSSFHRTLH